MKVDFLATWDAFMEATRHCQMFRYQHRDGFIVIRGGNYGLRYPAKDDDPVYCKILEWCQSRAYRIVESIPEELVFA